MFCVAGVLCCFVLLIGVLCCQLFCVVWLLLFCVACCLVACVACCLVACCLCCLLFDCCLLLYCALYLLAIVCLQDRSQDYAWHSNRDHTPPSHPTHTHHRRDNQKHTKTVNSNIVNTPTLFACDSRASMWWLVVVDC